MKKMKMIVALIVISLSLTTCGSTFALTVNPRVQNIVDINLGGNAVVVLSDGTFVLIGDESILDYEKNESAAVAIWINSQGEEMHRYEDIYQPNTRNYFYDAVLKGEDHILLSHVVIHTDYSEERFVLDLHNGQVVSRTKVDKPIDEIISIKEGLLLCMSGLIESKSDENIHYPRFVLTGENNDVIWDITYGQPFTPSHLLSCSKGAVVVGALTSEGGEGMTSYQYIAQINLQGDLLWNHVANEERSRFTDAIMTETDDVVAIGGVYESSDGYSPALSTMSLYSSEGSPLWEKTYDFSGRTLESIIQHENEYVVAGGGGKYTQQAFIATLTDDGEIVTEHIIPLQEIYTVYNVSLHNAPHGVYLVVSGISESNEEERERIAAGVPGRPHKTEMIKIYPEE